MVNNKDNIYKHVRQIDIDGTISINNLSLPLVLEPILDNANSTDRLEFIRNYKSELLSLVEQHGAILLRGWGKSNYTDFSEITNVLEKNNNFNMSCSAGPRIEVAHRVFTANEAPPRDKIPFHHEMAQCGNPPAFVIFFCDTPSSRGGNTPLISSFQVCKFLRKFYPKVTEKLIAKGVKYIRVLPKYTDSNNALGKSWKDTYVVSNKKDAEKKMTKEEISWSWHGDDFLRTVSNKMPTIIQHYSGQEVFFAAAETTFKSGNRKIDLNIPSKAICFGDNTELDDDTNSALLELGKFMENTCTTWQWKSGDVLIINNATVMHARNDFIPPRKILASLIGKLNRNHDLNYTIE